MDDFAKPKIVWADLARMGNAFIYDEAGFTMPNTTYLIASDDRSKLKLVYLTQRSYYDILTGLVQNLMRQDGDGSNNMLSCFPSPYPPLRSRSRSSRLLTESLRRTRTPTHPLSNRRSIRWFSASTASRPRRLLSWRGANDILQFVGVVLRAVEES